MKKVTRHWFKEFKNGKLAKRSLCGKIKREDTKIVLEAHTIENCEKCWQKLSMLDRYAVKAMEDILKEEDKIMFEKNSKKKLKISFDFDGTLEFTGVQDYAKDLIKRGYDVCILTTRYSDPTKYTWFGVEHATKMQQILFDVAKDVGITEIHFTEFEFKDKHIDKFDIDLHLDDNYREEVFPINNSCKAKAVLFDYGWIKRMDEAIAKLEGGSKDGNT